MSERNHCVGYPNSFLQLLLICLQLFHPQLPLGYAKLNRGLLSTNQGSKKELYHLKAEGGEDGSDCATHESQDEELD